MASLLNNWETTLPVFGGFFKNQDEEALKAQYQRMAETYAQYRQQNTQTRQAQLATQMDMFGPQQQFLNAMLPGIQQFNTQGAQSKFAHVTNGISGGQGPSGGQAPNPFQVPATYTPTGAK